VNISNNHIETFSLRQPVYLPEMGSQSAHLELTILGNPLLCDCFAMELKQELNENQAFSVRRKEEVMCGINSPPQLVNRSLIDVRFEVR
jgi:hypothetical protein